MHMGLCVLTVSNTLVISNATVIVRAGVCFWLMLVAIVLFISDTNVSIDLVLIFKCCVVIREMLFVMHGSTVFSGILANVERSEMGLYEVSRLLFLYGFGMRVTSTSICDMTLM